MWTQFRNDSNMPMQYVANTVSDQTVKVCQQLRASQVLSC